MLYEQGRVCLTWLLSQKRWEFTPKIWWKRAKILYNILKFSTMGPGYGRLGKLNKKCRKTVGEKVGKQTVWCWDLMDRWLLSSWHQSGGLLHHPTQHCSTQPLSSTKMYALVSARMLHGMVWLCPGGLLPKLYGMVGLAASWWFIAKMVPPSLTPILGHGHPLHPQVAPGIIETRGGFSFMYW